MLNFHKKEKPLQGLMGLGGGTSGYLAPKGSSVDNSDEYFYLPFNESSVAEASLVIMHHQ